MASLVVHDLVLSEASNRLVDSADGLAPIGVQFSAMDTDIQLDLEPSRFNSLAKQSSYDDGSTPRLYQGVITGDANSWARISLHDGQMSGHLFYYGKLLQLEHRSNVDDVLNDITSSTDYVLIEPASSNDAAPFLNNFYAAKDTISFAPTYPLSNEPSFKPNKIASLATSNRDGFGMAVTRALRIGIVVDSRFNEAHKNRGLARALGIINSVDAIYQSQLGIALIVEGIRVYDNPDTDPMRNNGGTVDEILTNFRPFRLADERLPTDLTLVHLFSGHRDPERVIGLGWISTACRLDGYDLSMSTPFPFDTLLAAHEIAHNLGALHDDDARCLAEVNRESNTLMWPELSGSSTATFSNCSIRYMRASKHASCNLENIDVSIRLRTYPSSESLRRSVVIEVANKDKIGRATELSSSTKFPGGTQIEDVSAGCTVTGTTVDCNHGTVQPGFAHSTSLSATLLSRSQENVITQVELLNATDVESIDNRAAIQLLQFDESSGEAIAASSQLLTVDDDTTASDVIVRVGSLSLLLLALLSLIIFTRLSFTGTGFTRIQQEALNQALRSTE